LACRSAGLGLGTKFLSEYGEGPFPLPKARVLRVEVTVPPSGPPRPIQLAVSSEAGWQALKFD